MHPETWYLIAADAILIVHSLFVAFVVFGLFVIYLGHWLRWPLVRNFWFRLSHIGAITYVVINTWMGELCPLTIWEMQLRMNAGDMVYQGSFIQHWLHSVLYYTAPDWVFAVAYTAFALLVLASWFVVPPSNVKKR